METRLQVERRPHPRGDAGAKISLEESAKRAAEGRLDPRTRAWAIEKIVQAGNPRAVLDRAAAILDALRKERIYIEDPTDAEFIPSAACTLHGCHGLLFLGEDCDGLLVSFLAAIGSIGIFGAVVGHSYEPTGAITHVLAGVFDGETWHRCDPSTKQSFGVVSAPTRERWIGVPDGRVICDKAKGGCSISQLEHPMARMRPSGDFVGVGGPHPGSVGEPPVMIYTPSTPSERAALSNQVDIETRQVAASLQETKFFHAKLVALRDELEKPFTDIDVTKSGSFEANGEVSSDAIWSQQDEDQYLKTVAASSQLISYGHEVIAGTRQAGRRDDTSEIVILGTSDEPQIIVSQNAQNAVLLNFNGEGRVTLARPSDGQVGWVAVAVGGLVVLAGIVAYLFYHDANQKEMISIDNAMRKDLKDFYASRRKAGDSHEDALSAVNAVNDAAVRRAKAQTELTGNTGAGQIAGTLQTLMWAAFGLGAVYVAGYAAVSLMQAKSRQEITGIPILAR